MRDSGTTLIVVDVQNGFMPGGRLPVPNGHWVVPVINRLAQQFSGVVLTQDWHPRGHISFASSHPGRKPFETVELSYGPQVLWPEHCVQGSFDAALYAELDVPHAELIIRKGFHPKVDSYSAFQEADRETVTGLDGYLRGRGIKRVFVCGLATDFCVAWTALDAVRLGYETWVVEDATRAIDLNGSLAQAWTSMIDEGIGRIQSAEIGAA
ncbi:MAG: bifunctional nicotinamidase/pyrazinamidase [Burkholderiaceae bacterium]|jgi:nicotinamidase/pyrazinamidase